MIGTKQYSVTGDIIDDSVSRANVHVEAELKEIKGFPGSEFKRISVDKLSVEQHARDPGSELRTRIDRMLADRKRYVERFLLVHLVSAYAKKPPMDQPVASSPGIEKCCKQLPEKSWRAGCP